MALAGAAAPGSAPYAEGPPPGHTGGFGEPTCRACHFDGGLNEGEGELRVKGLPGALPDGGSPLPLEVVLRDPALVRGGFQLTARYADGSHRGEQAGDFRVEGDRLGIQESAGTPGVLYLQHTDRGTEPGRPGQIRWAFLWSPPRSPSGPVVFHVAANAGNDDASEFGDWIYADSAVLRPQ